MESFLLICNVILMGLVVALTVIDERRKRGAPRASPFRINETMVARPPKRSGPLPPAYLRRNVRK